MAKVNENKIKSGVGVFKARLFYRQTSVKMESVNKILALLMAMTLLSSCQQDSVEIKLPPPAEAFTASSTTADLLSRVALRDGSLDNIIDSASCTSLLMPFSVLVNGQEVILQSSEDLKYVERLLDESEMDLDDIDINFPVTVILPDHTQLQILSEDAFERLKEKCIEGGMDDDIECIDFEYPITLAVYNSTNEVAEIVTIESDDDLYIFLDLMEEAAIVSINFPMNLKLKDESILTVGNNTELNAAIEASEAECDEDDDTDFEDDDVDTTNLVNLLLSGSWRVDYFFKEENQTTAFEGYSLTFNLDGSAMATKGVTTLMGTWHVYGDDGVLELVLDFGELFPWAEIREDWIVTNSTDALIELKDSEEEVNERTLVLKLN